MASIVNTEELEVLVLLKLSSDLAIDTPVFVLSTVEVGLTSPSDGVSPGLTTSPVANEVLIARVNEDSKATFKDTLDLGSEVSEPISEKFSVHFLAAFNPAARGRNVKSSLDSIIVEELV